LCLDNLPQGQFERGVINADDARTMIRDARTDRMLRCVSRDDLLAPYRGKERRRHEELCELLRTRYNFDIRFDDFLTTFDADEASAQSIMPLEVVELRPRLPSRNWLIRSLHYSAEDGDGTVYILCA
jgi:hypothetical protein